MLTKRFELIRRKDLEPIFEHKRMAKIWRDLVRDQMRDSEVRDLFDYYDFNFEIDDRVIALRGEILSGTYKARPPLIYRVEKKFGICRHIIVPSPADALILQCLTESIYPRVKASQPSVRAYYSRDRHSGARPHETSALDWMSWRSAWKHFQREIYKFNETKEFIVVTDLANYYDSIRFRELRSMLTGRIDIPEGVADLLFHVLQEVAWSPDYLPIAEAGLPVINIEAVRLLAHAFLFELDEILNTACSGNFVRWMDDVTFGVDTRKQATQTLSDVSELLKARGLALNLAKTQIYDVDAAKRHFQIEENKYIDSIVIPPTRKTRERAKLAKSLLNNLDTHLQDDTPRVWDKVTKRYITQFCRLKSKNLLPHVQSLYLKYPSIRPNLLTYLSTLGFSRDTGKVFLGICSTLDRYDDISLFTLIQVLTDWRIPKSKYGEGFLAKFEAARPFAFSNRFDFYCAMWFKAKYAQPSDLLQFILKFENVWLKDMLLRRQVTTVLARLYPFNPQKIQELLQTQQVSGFFEVVSVANMLLKFSTLTSLPPRTRLYLFPDKKPKNYPLAKFLVLCSVLNSPSIRSEKEIHRKVKLFVTDPFLLFWIKATYSIK